MICIIGIVVLSRYTSRYNTCNSKYNSRYDCYNSRRSERAERYNSRCNRCQVSIIRVIVDIIVIVGMV